MNIFKPDYTNISNSAKNIEAKRLPLYDHIVCSEIMEQVIGKKFADLQYGNYNDKKEFFRLACEFYKKMGYDTISHEHCIGHIMPDSGCLGGHKEPAIKDRADFERYPWDEIEELYFNAFTDSFKALGEVLPAGMKAIGGVGNGIFECVQDIVGFTDLCYIKADDIELYRDLFNKVGQTNLKIWKRFLKEFGDTYCVLRFGDDLGYKSNTMLDADDIRNYIIPNYKPIIEEVHKYNKPFLLHSCGCIFDVMDDLINIAKIDAKHSNEDQIAPFPYWVEKYGDKIGNFGGIDTDVVCRMKKPEMKEYIKDVIDKSSNHGGFAIGSGNSIPDYVPLEGYLNMNEIIREIRGDYR